MIYFVFLIPVLTSLFLFLKFRKETTQWEYALVLVPSALIILLLNTIMVHYRIGDDQYHSQFAWGVRYYEPWNEYIRKRCSSTHCSGSGKSRHCYTTYYDCSYVKYHDEEWTLFTRKREVNISKSNYLSLIKRFGTPLNKVDMKRHYHTINGDMFQTDWNGERESFYSIDNEESYDNKTRAFHQLFHFEDINDAEKIKWKLYEYPNLNSLKQSTVLGIDNPRLQNQVDYLNSRFDQFPFRLYILFFYEGENVVKKQKSYWEGGNENELVLCVGLDSLSGTINWVETFSWSGDKYLEQELTSQISIGQEFKGDSICTYLEKSVPLHWQPKKMKDYDYLEVEVNDTQLIWIYIILLLYNLGISYYIIVNEHKIEM